MINRNVTGFLIFVLTVSFLSTGCEPLRKKFTRKKKEAKKEEFIPVLEPEEYAAPEFNPAGEYKHRYNLWKLWHDDLMIAMEENSSTKRQQFIVGQLTTQLEEMGKLVTGDTKEKMEAFQKEMFEVKELLAAPAPMRNMSGIKNRINDVNEKLRENYKPEKVQEFVTAQ